MSQENVEIVRQAFAAINRGDRETAFGFADPEIVVDATRRVFNPTTYVGIQGIRAWAADMDEVWEEFRAEEIEFFDAGDSVVVFIRLHGKGTGSGVEVGQSVAGIWTVRNRRIVRVEIGYTDVPEALEALDLSEQDAHADS
jgi:ketosteroid isomerase-like protein